MWAFIKGCNQWKCCKSTVVSWHILATCPWFTIAFIALVYLELTRVISNFPCLPWSISSCVQPRPLGEDSRSSSTQQGLGQPPWGIRKQGQKYHGNLLVILAFPGRTIMMLLVQTTDDFPAVKFLNPFSTTEVTRSLFAKPLNLHLVPVAVAHHTHLRKRLENVWFFLGPNKYWRVQVLLFDKRTDLNSVAILLKTLIIWRVSKIWVPPNHPSHWTHFKTSRGSGFKGLFSGPRSGSGATSQSSRMAAQVNWTGGQLCIIYVYIYFIYIYIHILIWIYLYTHTVCIYIYTHTHTVYNVYICTVQYVCMNI